jgi:hypothetical protein
MIEFGFSSLSIRRTTVLNGDLVRLPKVKRELVCYLKVLRNKVLNIYQEIIFENKPELIE